MEVLAEIIGNLTEQGIKKRAPAHCRECPHLDIGTRSLEPFCKADGDGLFKDDCEVTLETWKGFPLVCRLCTDVVWYSYKHAECSDKDCYHAEFLESHIKKEEANVGPKN